MPNSIYASIVAEAERVSPLETGGVLLGYWVEEKSDVVVTHMIGPGPKAIHKRFRFAPDHRYQSAEITRIHAEHQCAQSYDIGYLGDWHTHPGSCAYLSGYDRATLKRIALTQSARAPQPVMFIFGQASTNRSVPGYGAPWQPAAWLATVSRRRFRRRVIETQLLELHIFEAENQRNDFVSPL